MPRIRTIKPEFWSHPVMGRQKDEVKTMGIALLNIADDEGYFYADPASIRSFARPFDEDSMITHGALQQLIRIDYIEVRQHPTRGFIGKIVSFLDHQTISHPTPSKIKKFFADGVPIISLGELQEDSSNAPSGKERKGKERKEENTTPSARKARGAGVNNTQVAKAAAQTRHSRLHELIMSWYQEWAGVECPWGGGEGRNLKRMLDSTPHWPDSQFVTCLQNLSASEECVPKGTRPLEWLEKLPKFLHGPLDRFWKPIGSKANGNGNYQSTAAKRDAANVEALVLSGLGARVQHVHADPGAAVQDRVDGGSSVGKQNSKATFAGN